MKINKAVKSILNKYRKFKSSKFKKNEMYAELLKRSQDFITRLNELIRKNAQKKPLFGKMWLATTDKNYGPYKSPPDSELKLVKYNLWTAFCNHFNIDPRWKGNIQNLPNFIKFVYIGNVTESVEIALYETKPCARTHCPLLPIWVTPWTGYSDIKKYWRYVNKWQKSQGEYFDLARSNLYRDLTWYDLHLQKRIRIREIASLWNKEFKDDIESIIAREVILKDDTRRNKGFRTKEIIEEKKKDPSNAKSIRQKIKIHGQSREFREGIKKAIQRMKKLIDRINSPFSFLKGKTYREEMPSKDGKTKWVMLQKTSKPIKFP